MLARMTRRALALTLAVTALSLALAFTVKARCGVPSSLEGEYLGWCYSDIPPLFFSERLDQGAVPYLDHPVEYPVLTGAQMGLTGAVSDGGWQFLVANALLLAGAGLATAGLLARETGWPRALAFAAAPTLAISAFVNWDLLAVFLATAGLVAHRRAADTASGALLGLGTAAKLYPGLFVPLVALAAWRARGRRAGIATAAAAVGAWMVVNVPVLVAAPSGWWEFFRLSRERPADWDALANVAGHVTGWAPSTPVLNAISGGAFVAGAVAVGVVAVRRDPPERWHLAALPLLAWFLLTSKVYSPQFSLWLLPLFALAFPGWAWWGVFAVADVAVTATRFPYLANFVTDEGLDGAWDWGPFGSALVVRAVVLGTVAWVGWRRAAARPLVPANDERVEVAA
ncbi:MAG: DUF2029 domain-containing protein [Actinobacteria bacterium]|nr:DUF2029 domain-containing protein [Actinomycetota bacterium]